MKYQVLALFSFFITTQMIGMYMGSQDYVDGYWDGRKYPVNTIAILQKKFEQVKNSNELNETLDKLARSADPLKRKLVHTIKTVIIKSQTFKQ